MRVAALQFDMAWEDPATSFERLLPWLEAAAAQHARLVILPEMFACGFSMATDRIAEPPGGPSEQFLRAQASRHGFWLAGSVPERVDGEDRPFNTLLLVGPEGTVHRYRKRKPFTYGGEAEHYAAGSEDLTVSLDGVRFSFFVCYDLRFADLFWHRAEKTDAYVVVASWPETRRRHWQALLEARAIENQAFVIGVNRVGTGGRLTYVGDSCVLDPMGQTIVAAAGQESLLVANVDPEAVRQTREKLPFLQDR
jgi:predicted amidohydrolase